MTRFGAGLKGLMARKAIILRTRNLGRGAMTVPMTESDPSSDFAATGTGEGEVDQRSLTVLGSGTSAGVPLIGCDCPVCTSTDPRNHRTRASVILRTPGGNVLIDASPEMRLQLIRERITTAHAIAFTHFHADHLFGLDDARMFPKYVGGSIPVHCEPATEAVIRKVFSYAFQSEATWTPGGGVPKLHFARISPGVPFQAVGLEILPIRLKHGRLDVLGFRVGNLAYCTDVSAIPDASLELLQGLDTLLIDAVRYRPHPTHFHVEAALEVIDQLQPREAYLTHLSHELDHEVAESQMPPGVRLAYDGLTLEF